MSGVAVETMLDLWASELRGAKGRMRPLFAQERVATSAGLFLDGPLGPERRKAGWSGETPFRPCAPRRPVTRDRGGSRPSSAVAGGRRTRRATSCATTRRKRSPSRTPCR